MIAAVILSFIVFAFLFGSALTKVQDISHTDDSGAGPWGVMIREPRNRRRLPPSARRWQNALTRAEKDQAAWHELIDYIDSLELRAGGELVDHERPAQVDRRYLKARVARLDSMVEPPEFTSTRRPTAS